MTEAVIFARGQKYPTSHPTTEGASADFLRTSGNRLFIYLPGMDSKEENALRNGMIKVGLLHQGGAMLWLFQIYGKDGKPLLTLDAPFDARLIPSDEIQLHNIDSAEQRLLIDLHAVDDNSILRAIRALTMPPDLTLTFLSAVQDQLASADSGNAAMQRWMQQQPMDLIKQIKTWVLGR